MISKVSVPSCSRSGPPRLLDSLNLALRASLMGVPWATFFLAVFIFISGNSSDSTQAEARACLAFCFEKSKGQSTQDPQVQPEGSQQDLPAEEHLVVEPAPRLNTTSGCNTSRTNGLGVSLLPCPDDHDAVEMHCVLRSVEACAMATTQKIEIQRSEGWSTSQRRSKEGSASPFRRGIWGAFRDQCRRSIDSMGGIVTTLESTRGKDRDGEEWQRFSKGIGRKGQSGVGEDCPEPHRSSQGDKRSNSEGDCGRDSRSTESCPPFSFAQSGQFEENSRSLDCQAAGVRLRMGSLLQQDEGEILRSKKSLHGKQRADHKGHRGEKESLGPSHRRFAKESYPGENPRHQHRSPRRRRGNLSMGCRSGDAGIARVRRPERFNQTNESTKQESEVGEMNEFFPFAPGPTLEAAWEDLYNSSFDCEMVFCGFGSSFVTHASANLFEVSMRSLKMLTESPEWQSYAFSCKILSELWMKILCRVVDATWHDLLLVLVGMLGFACLLLFGVFVHEATTTRRVNMKVGVTICRRRATTRRVYVDFGVKWKNIGIYYLLLWQHQGVLAGNLVPTTPWRTAEEGSRTEASNEFLTILDNVRHQSQHVFELWVHHPAREDDFVALKRLMVIDTKKPHRTQIETTWRRNVPWQSLDFVRVSHDDSYNGFLGSKYLAFPPKEGKIPLLISFNGIRAIMIGTVMVRVSPQGISLKDLFDILDPANQCDRRHLCSIIKGDIKFWPGFLEVEAGRYLVARQVDLDESSNTSGSDQESCSSTRASWNDGSSTPDPFSQWDEEQPDTNQLDEQNLLEQQEFASLLQTGKRGKMEQHDIKSRLDLLLKNGEPSCAAGSFPDRMRGYSPELIWRMQQTWDRHYQQWQEERDLIERNTQLTGQDQIMAEMQGLRAQRDGVVRLFLFGLRQEYEGMEILDVDVNTQEDFVDTLVLIRRVWTRRFPVGVFHVHYILRQLPPHFLGADDGVSWLCDFQPHLRGVPMVIVSITTFLGAGPTHDVSAHRTNVWANCPHLLHITGFSLVCTHNARCECDEGVRSFNEIPVQVFPGKRIDLVINFDLDEQGNRGNSLEEVLEQDGSSLMQTMPDRRADTTWLYGYPLHGREMVRAWDGGRDGKTKERFLAGPYCLQRPELLPDHLKVYEVQPQPVDLIEKQTRAYVMAAQNEVQPWQVIVLVDLLWVQGSEAATGSTLPQDAQWRATKSLEFQIDLRELYQQLVISIFCEPDPSLCSVWLREEPWDQMDQMRRLMDGDYVRVWIRSALDTIPLGTQWDLAQQGCPLHQMQARLEVSRSPTTITTTRSPHNASTNMTQMQDDPDISTLMQQIQSLSCFVYLQGEDEPIAEQLVAHEVNQPAEALKRRFSRMVPSIRPENMVFFRVTPQPDDLIRMDTLAFLHTLDHQIPPHKVLTMLDVEFYGNQRPQWRQRPTPSNEWREIRTFEEHTTRHDLLQEAGLRPFCFGLDTICLLAVRGRLWPVQDFDVRQLFNGDYIVVKIRARETEGSVQEQWRNAHGICQEQQRHPYQQALVDHVEGRDRENSDDEHRVMDNVSMLQLWRPTPVKHASMTLSPPGNGTKKVMFCPEVEEESGTRKKDLTMDNRFLRAFCETRQQDKLEERERIFLHQMRFQEDETIDDVEKNDSIGCLLPVLEGCREAHQMLPIASDNSQSSPTILVLDELVKPTKKTSILLDQLIPQGNFHPEPHSTAVRPNPRLDGSGEQHVHGLQIRCLGLSDLAEVVVEPWEFELQKHIPHGDFLAPGILENVWWAGPEQKKFEEIRVYTDGSHIWNANLETKVAAWSFSVVGVDENGHEWFLGFHARRVDVEENSPNSMGSLVEDSDHGETEAIIWAILWGMQSSFARVRTPFVIISDAKTKVFGFQGSWKMKKSQIAKTAQAMVAAFQQLTQCEFEWTRGHQGNTYNEIADHTARFAALCPEEVCMPELAYILPSFGNLISWLWCIFRSRFHSEFPKLQGDNLCFQEPLPMTNETMMQDEEKVPENLANLRLDLLSYNVNTLKENTQRGRMELIFQQIKTLGANVIGLQETRRRSSKQFVKEPFIVFSSAALKGQGGIDLYLRTDKHFMDEQGVKRYFSINACTVIKADPRILVIRYKSEGWTAIFAVLHAPHEQSPLHDKTTFWKMVEDILKPYRDLPCCVMMDANARIGSKYHPGIGSAFPQEENENGGLLANFVLSMRLFLPATFSKHILNPQEDQGTWFHKTGTTRLDYIALPMEWADGNIHTDVVDCEKAENFKDHRITLVCLDTTVSIKEHIKKKKTQAFSREKMRTSEARDFIRKTMLQYNDLQIPVHPRRADQHVDDLYSFVDGVMKGNFTRSRRTERPTWIKDTTWQNLVALKRVRRELKIVQTNRRVAILRQIFQSWRDATAPTPSQQWLKQVHMKAAELEKNVIELAPLVKGQLAEDESAYFTYLAEAFSDRCKEADGTEIWKAIRMVLPKYRARIKNKAMNFTHTIEKLEGYFAEIESAQAVETSQLMQTLTVKAETAKNAMKQIPRDLNDVPTLLEFEQALQKNKSGKSVFGDLLPEWVLACPREMAVQAYPIFLNLFLWAQQPAQLKGGRYFPLWKGKHSQTNPSSFRAILINALLAKTAHHVLRQRLVGPLRSILTGFQVGGLPGMSVTFASHSLSLRREAAAYHKRSHAVIFCAFRSAFYSVRRSLLTDNCLNYADFWEDEGMAVSAATDISPMEEAGVPKALRAVVQEVLNSSWYHVPLPGIDAKKHWIPSRGSRPGDPIADIAFTYLMARILHLVVKDTEEVHPKVADDEENALPLLPITWVDDTCFMVEDPDPDQLLAKVTQVISSLQKHSAANGLDLNFDKGKSELLLRFQGKGALSAHRRFRSQGGGVHFADGQGNTIRMNSTSRYTHLGMIQTSAMNGDAEVNRRLALAGEALRAIRMKVLRNESISRKRRFDLARAIILSRLFYGTEVWTVFHAKHLRKFDGFLYRIHREILGFHSFQENERRSYLQLEAEYPFVDAVAFIRLRRLAYFRKCKVEAPQILLAQIRQDDQLRENSWLDFLVQDFTWLKKHLDLPEAPREVRETDAWWNFAAEDATRWKNWGIKVMENAAISRQKDACIALHKEKEPEVWDPMWCENHLCVHCGKQFNGRAALTVHQYKAHLILAPERAYMYDTTCGSCLRDYHTMQRLRQHLQQHRGCFSHLAAVWLPRENVEIGDVDETASRNDHRLPFDLVSGPMLPTREAWEKAAPWKKFPDGTHERKVEEALLLALDASRSDTERQTVLDLADELLAPP